MKARIETGRIRFRVIFLLLVQTVCLAALPNGTTAVQQISGAVICTELAEENPEAVRQNPQSVIRQMQKSAYLHASGAGKKPVCVLTALPCRRTLVQSKVRMDN